MEPVSLHLSEDEVRKKLDDINRTLSEDAVIEEKHDLGHGPVITDREIFSDAEKVENGRAEAAILSHRLDELSKDYFLFTFGPVYAGTGFKYDAVYQFGVAMAMDRVPKVVAYNSPSPIFTGIGSWDNCLQGLPKDMGEVFDTFVLNMVIPDSVATPRQYWRINSHSMDIHTPRSVTAPAPVTVYTPTGMDYCIEPYKRPDGSVVFCSKPPEEWVVKEAQRFFLEQ
jgi:hypothetical protein